MQATVQFTMEFEPKYGILLLDDFLDNLANCLYNRYANQPNKYFTEGGFALKPGTRVTKLVQDGEDETTDARKDWTNVD